MRKNISLFASQRLVELLSNIEHHIPHTLLETLRYGGHATVSYLDFGSTNDTISFISASKFNDIVKANRDDYQSLAWKEKRSEMKIGKLIRMIYGDSFPINHPKGIRAKSIQNDIESFVNRFKAEREKDINYDRFEVVSGSQFHHWYLEDNHSRFAHESTTLGKSCLRYERSTNFLKIYSKNPSTFAMLILKDERGKLRGRANLWNLTTPEGRVYMDRIYSVNDFDIELFKDYARKNGWLHKEKQTYSWKQRIVDTVDNKVYDYKDMIMTAVLSKRPGVDFSKYPYFDTLSIYNPITGTLTNDGRIRVMSPNLLLTDYQGSYRNEGDTDSRVYSKTYDEYIREREAKFVELDEDYVYSHDAVYVKNTGGKYAYINSDKIARCDIFKTAFFLKEDAIYSKYMRTNIYKDSVRTAYLDGTKKDEVLIHYKMVGKDFIEADGIIIKRKKRKMDMDDSDESSYKMKKMFDIYSSPSSTPGYVTWSDSMGDDITTSVDAAPPIEGESDDIRMDDDIIEDPEPQVRRTRRYYQDEPTVRTPSSRETLGRESLGRVVRTNTNTDHVTAARGLAARGLAARGLGARGLGARGFSSPSSRELFDMEMTPTRVSAPTTDESVEDMLMDALVNIEEDNNNEDDNVFDILGTLDNDNINDNHVVEEPEPTSDGVDINRMRSYLRQGMSNRLRR